MTKSVRSWRLSELSGWRSLLDCWSKHFTCLLHHHCNISYNSWCFLNCLLLFEGDSVTGHSVFSCPAVQPQLWHSFTWTRLLKSRWKACLAPGLRVALNCKKPDLWGVQKGNFITYQRNTHLRSHLGIIQSHCLCSFQSLRGRYLYAFTYVQ